VLQKVRQNGAWTCEGQEPHRMRGSTGSGGRKVRLLRCSAPQCYTHGVHFLSLRLSVKEAAEAGDAVVRRMRSMSIFEAIEADDAAVIEAHASTGTELNVRNRCALHAALRRCLCFV
jgi:hypothetical protein